MRLHTSVQVSCNSNWDVLISSDNRNKCALSSPCETHYKNVKGFPLEASMAPSCLDCMAWHNRKQQQLVPVDLRIKIGLNLAWRAGLARSLESGDLYML